MVTPDWSRLLVGLAVIVAVVATPAFVVPATAKAPPEPVCGVCTDALNEAASAHGVDLERANTSMTVKLTANGSARFSAHVGLTKGANALRNDTLREEIVRDISYILADDRRHLQTWMNGTTLVVRYTNPDVAHTTLGIVQFDAFQTKGAPPFASGGEGSPYPGADRLVLRAPGGFRVHGTHGDTNNATSIVWHGDSHGQFEGDIEEDVVISFVREDATLPNIQVGIANFLDWAGSLLN